jgi:copper homeostasis protein
VRLQLCDGLVDGGVTPSLGKIGESGNTLRLLKDMYYLFGGSLLDGFLEAVLLASAVPVNVLIRPRPGDFVYSPEEVDIMLRDVVHCKSAGVSYVVVLKVGSLDLLACGH